MKRKRTLDLTEIHTGNDIRQALVNAHYAKDREEYDALIEYILRLYHDEKNKGFFIHLSRNMIPNERNKGFRPCTNAALKRALTRLQEEAIPESMEFLAYCLRTDMCDCDHRESVVSRERSTKHRGSFAASSKE